jgi:hypothetical protein
MAEAGAAELVVPNRPETATAQTVRVTRTESHPPPASHLISCPHRQVELARTPKECAALRPFFASCCGRFPPRHRTAVKMLRR